MWDDGVPPNPSFILSKFIRVSERLLHLALPFNVHGDVILPYVEWNPLTLLPSMVAGS